MTTDDTNPRRAPAAPALPQAARPATVRTHPSPSWFLTAASERDGGQRPWAGNEGTTRRATRACGERTSHGLDTRASSPAGSQL